MDYNFIQFFEEGYFLHMDAMKEAVEALELPVLRATRDSTTAGLQFIPNLYNDFRGIVSKYILLFKRDMYRMSDGVRALVQSDISHSNFDPTTYTSQMSHTNSLLYENVSAELAEYTVGPAAHLFPDWLFVLEELDNMSANVIENMVILSQNIDALRASIDAFVDGNNISGAGANEMKSNFRELHFSVCSGLWTAAQAIYTNISSYWHSYFETYPLNFNGSNYTIDKGGMRAFLNALGDVKSRLCSINANYSYATTNLYIDSNYALDYTGSMPDIQPVLSQYHIMDDTGEAILNAVEANEDYLVSLQSTIEEPVLLVVEEINRLVDNCSGATAYYSNDTLEQLNINDYNETFNEIRENNEANIDEICWGMTRAGELNTEFEDSIEQSHDELDAMLCIMTLYLDFLGIGELAALGGTSYEWTMGLISLGFDSQFINDNLYMIVYMFGGDEELYEILSDGSELMVGVVDTIHSLHEGDAITSPSDVLLSLDSDTLIALETAAMLYLRDQPAEAVVTILEDSGIPSCIAEWVVYTIDDCCPIDLSSVEYTTPAEWIMTVTGLWPTMHADIADALEQNLEVETYEATLDDRGYDEERLRDMGLIG